MVEKNSFLGNMISKKASVGDNKPTDALTRVDNNQNQNYNAETFSIIKMRLIEQRSQLSRMADHSQDSAIKLNDIYEILKDLMNPSISDDKKEVTRTQEETAYKSSLDNFFKQNGYIPVKILNSQDGSGFDIDIDIKRKRGKYGRLFSAVTAIVGALGLTAASAYAVSDIPEIEAIQPPESDLRPETEVVPNNDLLSAPISGTNNLSSAPTAIPQTTSPDVPFAPGPMPLNDLSNNKTLAGIMTALASMMASIQILTSKAAGAPPLGMGGTSALGFGGWGAGGPSRFNGLNRSIDGLLNISQMTNNRNTKLLTLEAREIVFEADKFDFIQRSLFAPITKPNNMVVAASYTPTQGSENFSTAETGNVNAPSYTTNPSYQSSGITANVVDTLGSATSAMGSFPGFSALSDVLSTGASALSGVASTASSMMKGSAGGSSDLRTGIMESAAALGMDPVDLATIISYETAGTFDPTKAGPTTKWGKHRGLIQFGEPQAKQYGVDWNDPIGSQLGPNGAVVKYFLDNGWKPGMSMLDAYSIVNAGAPGRYNASDTAAGGAPGTVYDKVTKQMGGHREKALSLIGGTDTPIDRDRQSTNKSVSTQKSTVSIPDILSKLSKDVMMKLEIPQRPTTGGAVNIINNVNPQSSPAYKGVDEPMAAMDDMMKKLFDEAISI